jgi:hypothetical protein
MLFAEFTLISLCTLSYFVLSIMLWRSISIKEKGMMGTGFFIGMVLFALLGFSRPFMEKKERDRAVFAGCVFSLAVDYAVIPYLRGAPPVFILFYFLNILSVHAIAGIRVVSFVKERRRSGDRHRHRAEKMPSIRTSRIGKSDETKLLRTKTPYVVNGEVVIRKGESVQLLKRTGEHYYVVRKFSGAEYVVPKSYFY